MADHDADAIGALAALIRDVDGSHQLGAAALAEALVHRGVTFTTAILRQLGVQPVTRPTDALLDSEGIAANIVHQIGDALYEALPADIAHKYFVAARQATNDRAIAFTQQMVRDFIDSTRQSGQ